MTKRLFIIVLVLILSSLKGSSQNTYDIKGYLESIKTLPIDTLKERSDRLINSTTDSSLMSKIAYTIFNHYYSSPYMGQEAVAVYIGENYFLNKKLHWDNPEGYYMMMLFVEYNKSSLIGMNAPELKLTDSTNRIISLRDLKGENTILYFFDDNCTACKATTKGLRKIIDEYSGDKLNVYTVYTQSNEENWKQYIEKNFSQERENVNIYNVRDIDFSSDFPKLYSVLKTPQLLLLDNQNIILGRNLDISALRELLNVKPAPKDDLTKFFGDFFGEIEPADSISFSYAIDLFYEKSKGNRDLFNEIFKELYIFLKEQPDYEYLRSATYLSQKYIFGMAALWSDSSFVEETKYAFDLFYKNPLGKKAENLTLNSVDDSSYSIYDSKTDYTVLYFYNFNCEICKIVSEDLTQIEREYRSKGVNFIAIYTGHDYNKWIKYIVKGKFDWINLWDKDSDSMMYQKYNLSSVPAIYLLDSDKITIAKDINPISLEQLLKTASK